MEIWQNLEKNATQIMIFLPHLCGRKIKMFSGRSLFRVYKNRIVHLCFHCSLQEISAVKFFLTCEFFFRTFSFPILFNFELMDFIDPSFNRSF